MLKVRLNLRKVVAIAICLIGTTMFLSCDGNENNNDTEYLTCDKIHSSASTFTTLNVRIGSTYADRWGYSRLRFETYSDSFSGKKSFIVAESEKDSKNQTFTLKDVPNEYLDNLITDVYQNVFENGGWIWKLSERYKSFLVVGRSLIENYEMDNINISNKNTKIAIIYQGSIGIYAKGIMGNDDGDDALGYYTSAQMSSDYENGKIECSFRGGDLVYSDSDCDITGYIGDRVINIYLRKGWNKVFDFDDRRITTDDIKDSHLLWYQWAG